MLPDCESGVALAQDAGEFCFLEVLELSFVAFRFVKSFDLLVLKLELEAVTGLQQV